MRVMNGLVRERNWLGEPLVGGYAKSKTMEKVLSITFAAAYHITRQFKIMVFPTVFIRICGTFAYIPAMFLPWRYTLVVPIIVAFTSVEPIGSTLALTAGIQAAYFSSRFLKKYRILSLLLATFVANLTAYGVRVSMGLIPADVGFTFYMLKTTITAVAIVILAPMILKILESKDIINFKR